MPTRRDRDVRAALALLALILATPARADEPARPPAEVDACLARVKAVHGGGGPWAVVGYRMGERALKDLGLPPQSFALSVVHKAPMQVQYTCMADGLQAATGASVGKLNLRLEEAARADLATTVVDRKAGRRLRFTIDPALAASIADLPFDRLEAEGRRVAALPDDRIFRVVEDRADADPGPGPGRD